MLAQIGSSKDFRRKSYIWEAKFDGTRAIVYKQGDTIRILNRRARWIEYRYPEFTEGLPKLIRAKSCILDGEIIITDEKGRPDFHLLQKREQLGRKLEIELRSKEMPATLVVFDILELEGKNLKNKPLSERKALLDKVVRENSILAKSIWTRNGTKLFREVKKLKLEGVMGKDLNSPYLIGKRTESWIKIKFLKTVDCVIVGWKEGSGWREPYFASLALALYDKRGKLQHVGHVGTGWDEDFLKFWTPKLKKIEVKTPPVKEAERVVKHRGRGKVAPKHWCKPLYVCEVEFLEVTPVNHELRAPAFKRMRTDKEAKECTMEELMSISKSSFHKPN